MKCQKTKTPHAPNINPSPTIHSNLNFKSKSTPNPQLITAYPVQEQAVPQQEIQAEETNAAQAEEPAYPAYQRNLAEGNQGLQALQEAGKEDRRVEGRGGRWGGWEAFRWDRGGRGAWRACRDRREVVGGLGEIGREELQACRGMAEGCHRGSQKPEIPGRAGSEEASGSHGPGPRQRTKK